MIHDKIYKALNRVLTKADLETLTQATIRDIATANNIDLEVDVLSEETKQKFLEAAREHKQNSYQLVDVKETINITVNETGHQLVDNADFDHEKEEDPAEKEEEDDSKDQKALTIPQSSALTYTNDFSKALAVQKVSDENKLVLSQEQIYNVAQSLPNSFEDYTDFVAATLAIFEEIFESDNLQAVNLASETLERIRNNRNKSRHVIYSNIEKTFNSMKDDDIANIKQITKLNDLAKSFKMKGSKKNG